MCEITLDGIPVRFRGAGEGFFKSLDRLEIAAGSVKPGALPAQILMISSDSLNRMKQA